MGQNKTLEHRRAYARQYYKKNKNKILAQRKVCYTINMQKKRKNIMLLELHRYFLVNT